MNKSEAVKVTIADRNFRIKSNSDNHAERIKSVAQYVDAKFQEIAKERPTLSYVDTMTLVAMNLCEELFTEKLKHELQQSVAFK